MTTLAAHSAPQAHSPRALRRAGWAIQRKIGTTLAATRSAISLARLAWRARTRKGPGQTRIDGLALHYDDPRSLLFEYKHVFVQRLYDFRPTRPDPRILDGGGHIGLSALRFKRLAPAASITTFEPDPRVLPLLRRNLTANGAPDVEIVPAALACQAGQAAFSPDGLDGGALATTGQAAALAVATVRLSDYLTEPVDFLKLNIEGAEVDVIREAKDRLRIVRQIAIEYHGFPELGERLGELLTCLAEAGFRCVVHSFDHRTNPAGQPPFRVRPNTRWFALIAGTRDGQ